MSTLRTWTMAKCYSGSAAELVYHLSCLYTLPGTLDEIEEKSQSQFQGDSADKGAMLIMMLRQLQVLTVWRLSTLLVSLRRMS